MTDVTRLHDLVETWHTTAGDAIALLREKRIDIGFGGVGFHIEHERVEISQP